VEGCYCYEGSWCTWNVNKRYVESGLATSRCVCCVCLIDLWIVLSIIQFLFSIVLVATNTSFSCGFYDTKVKKNLRRLLISKEV